MKRIVSLLLFTVSSLTFASTSATDQFDKIFGDFVERMKHMANDIKSINEDDFFTDQSWLRYDEKNKNYVIHISTNNLEKNEINITTKARVLTVTGTSEQSKSSDSDDGQIQQYQSSAFHQSFTLPKDADIDNIEARQESDVLIITVPRLIDESAVIKKIEIN